MHNTFSSLIVRYSYAYGGIVLWWRNNTNTSALRMSLCPQSFEKDSASSSKPQSMAECSSIANGETHE